MNVIRRSMALAAAVAALVIGTGCTSQDVPQAHKGRMFQRTGAMTLWTGGEGYAGPVLNPGTHFTGVYNAIGLVNCSELTEKETLGSLTKDNIQFKLDVYTRFAAACSDANVQLMLVTLDGGPNRLIAPDALYGKYIRPNLGEAVRRVISPYAANDINKEREKVVADIRTEFMRYMSSEATGTDRGKQFVDIREVNLSNFDFPDEVDKANLELAEQAILASTAIARRARITEELTTAVQMKGLREREGEAEAMKIDKVGAALQRNPHYIDFVIAQQLPAIYEKAGAQGNMVIAGPSPSVLVQPRAMIPRAPPTRGQHATTDGQ